MKSERSSTPSSRRTAEAVSRPARRRLLKTAVNGLLLTAGFLLTALVLKASGMSPAALLDRFREVRFGYLLLAGAAYGFQSLFIAKRWTVLLGCYADLGRLPKGFIFYATNLGLLLTSFVPVVGNMGAKALVCKLEQDISLPKTVFAVSLEYLLGFAVIAAMIVPGSLYALGLLGVPAATAVLVLVSAALLIGFPRGYRFFLSRIGGLLAFGERRLGRFALLRRLAGRANTLSGRFADIGPRASAKLVRYSLLTYFVVLARSYLCVLAFDIPVGFLEFSLLFAWGYALSCVGVTPGSLGVAELGWFGVLTFAGVGKENAAFFALGKRVVDLAAALALAAGSYVYSGCRKRAWPAEPWPGRGRGITK